MLYVVYAYWYENGALQCHIYSGEAGTASWSQPEAVAALAAIKQQTPQVDGMVLPIEVLPEQPVMTA